MESKIEREISILTKGYESFLSEPDKRNHTVYGDLSTFYIRKMLHPVNPMHLCIGSIDVDESVQGSGILTGLLTHIENNLHGYAGIEFESILNQELSSYLLRRGYTHPHFRPADSEFSRCLWLENFASN